MNDVIFLIVWFILVSSAGLSLVYCLIKFAKESAKVTNITATTNEKAFGNISETENLNEAAMIHYKDVMERKFKTNLETANITSFKEGAKWQKRQTITKACEWLKDYAYFSNNELTGSFNEEDLVNRFKKAMEG